MAASAGNRWPAGAKLYEQLACITCHGTGKGPPFVDLFGKPVKLSDGTTVVADEAYMRESVLYPSAKIVEGYQPIMPTFKGQVTEEQLLQLDRLHQVFELRKKGR